MSNPGQPREPAADDQQYEVVVPDLPVSHAHAPAASAGSRDPFYGAMPQRTPTDGFAAPAPSQRLPHGPISQRVWWIIGGAVAAALVIVMLVVSGVFTANDDPEPGEGNQATGQYDPPPSGGTENLRIVDKDSGISYDYLGEGWKDWQMGVMTENQTTVGEYIVTQPTVPMGGEFIAQVTSGLLHGSFGTPSLADFPSTLAALEESVRGNYYPQPNKPTNPAEQKLTIDGHDAYQRSMDLVWDVDGYDSTGERVVLLLIDTGKSAPVFMYCSFPNTHAELYPLIEQVIASIKVDQ